MLPVEATSVLDVDVDETLMRIEKGVIEEMNDDEEEISIIEKKEDEENVCESYSFALKVLVVMIVFLLLAGYIEEVVWSEDKRIIGMMFQSKSAVLTNHLKITDKIVMEGKGNITVIDANNDSIVLPFKESTIIKFEQKEEPKLSMIEEPESYWWFFVNKVSLTFTKRAAYNALSLIANHYKKDKEIDFLEYYNLNNKYGLEDNVTELPFCILSPSRNFMSHNGQSALQILLTSLENQNYSNFELFLIDDFSKDNSVTMMEEIINEQYPRVRNRVTIVQNKQVIGALGNRDIISRNFCKNESVIVELDSDDALIGKQVLNVINRLYKRNPENWVIYSNYVELNYAQSEIDLGDYSSISSSLYAGGPISNSIFVKNKYRTEIGIFSTSHLKTYLRELYLKIPLSYLFETGKKYHLLATDRFNIYPIIELSGPLHTMYLEELIYLYRIPKSPSKLCKSEYGHMKEMESRNQPSLLHLGNLTDHAVVTPDYKVPLKIIEETERAKENYKKCSSQLKEGELYRD